MKDKEVAVEFWKMNGAGNDFIVIDNYNGTKENVDWQNVAKVLCERHLSIGADGMMVVEKPEKDGDYKMMFYNSDGSIGEMCGNGARCICRYGYENGLAGDTQVVETTAGIVTGKRIDEKLYKIRLNSPSIIKLDCKAEIDGKTVMYDYIELGNPGLPHIIVNIEDLKDFDKRELYDLGKELRYYKDLPKGANVNFYDIVGEDLLYEITYERGVEDFTYACGTGTGSLVTILSLKGKVSGNDVKVDMLGGQLIVNVDNKEGTIENIFLTGPTNIVAKGVVTDENLTL